MVTVGPSTGSSEEYDSTLLALLSMILVLIAETVQPEIGR